MSLQNQHISAQATACRVLRHEGKGDMDQVSAQGLHQLTARAPKGSKAIIRCSTAGTLPGSFLGTRNCAQA